VVKKMHFNQNEYIIENGGKSKDFYFLSNPNELTFAQKLIHIFT
jgi:hypothetical protein